MHKILVIEDQKLTRAMLCDKLKELGYEVVEAEDGMEGMTQVENEGISMVITDLVMPNFDGVNFLELVTSCHPDIKVLSWTSLSKENSVYQEASKILGEDKIITKSNNLDKIINKIKAILNS